MRNYLFTALFMVLTGAMARADLAAGACAPDQNARTTTQHTTIIAGKSIAYTATVGFMEVTAADQNSKACLFFTSYTANTLAGDPQRPLTFAFNGGPGSASVWLHLGLLGPKRVDMGADGMQQPRTLDLVTNDFSPLDVTDIVLIDPVATGFSHAEPGSTNDKFFGVRNDYMSLGAFIRNYLNDFKRWDSPKFLMGESYGGMRGSLLANYLQSSLGIGLNGIVFISPALSYSSLGGADDTDNVPYWTFFPTYATTAWYHHRIAAKYKDLSVDEVFHQAQKFAMTTYRDALDQGDQLPLDQLDTVAGQMAEWIGVDKQKLVDEGLKEIGFFDDALGLAGETIGRYDSRFVGHASDLSGDPSYTLLSFPFTAGINQYLRSDLNFMSPSPYAMSGNVSPWNPEPNNPTTSVVGELANALSENPQFKVFIASGYYDLACPMGTVEYDLSQMPNGRAVASRIQLHRFPGGHMMYINPQALGPLKAAIAEFMTGGQPALLRR